MTKLSNKKSLQEQESITSLFDELRAYLEKNHKQSLAEHEFEQECLTGLQEQLNAFSQGCSELLEKQYNAIVHQCEVQEKPRQDSLGALKLEKDQLQESIQQLTLRTEKVIQDQWIIIQHLQAQLEKYKHTSSTK
ncbi:MAG: hypothetical protein FJZ58_07560 [Chlamydiae bacterium]|nr:hypothetical protein [Chlamydiota bacterium]